MERKKSRDPIIEELRRIREEHAAKFNYDVVAIGRDLQVQERKSGRTYISMSPTRLQPDDANGRPAAL